MAPSRFEAVRHVAVAVPDLDRALAFFVDGLGYDVGLDTDLDPVYAEALWDQRDPRAARIVEVGPPGATSGLVRLVASPGLDPEPPRPSIRQVGPFAVTCYARDLDATLARVAALGHDTGVGVRSYTLPGADFEVSEAIVAGPGGVNVALVHHLPAHHRCVLNDEPGAAVSEVATVGHVVPDADGATRLYRDVLGGRVYVDGRFGGPAVEDLSGLDPGEDMRVVMFRGPSSANARIEIIQPARPQPLTSGPRRPLLAAAVCVPDLEALVADLRTAPDLGAFTGGGDSPVRPASRRWAAFRTADGFPLELCERP